MIKQLNYYWRVTASGISFTLFGAGALLLSLIFLLVVRPIPTPDSTKHRWLLSCIKGLATFFIGCMKGLGLITVQTRGESLGGMRGNLIVANHPSLIDALFILAATDNLCCIVKTELWRNPFTSHIVRLAGYLPNHSGTLLVDAVGAIHEGKNLLVFPEGTRNTYNDQLEFKRGAANITLSAECPITPVVIEVYPRTLQKGDKWYQMASQTPQFVITTYPSLAALDNIDRDRPVTLQARQLTENLISFYRDKLTEFAHGQQDPGQQDPGQQEPATRHS